MTRRDPMFDDSVIACSWWLLGMGSVCLSLFVWWLL